MSDYSELKKAADAASKGGHHIYIHARDDGNYAANALFHITCKPEDVLALIDEVEVSDKIIAERDRLLDAIPACPVHGHCVPHAIEWVEKAMLMIRELKAENEALRKNAERYEFLREQPSCYMHAEGWQIRRHWKDQSDAGRPHGMNTMCVSGESLDQCVDAAIYEAAGQ